MSINLTEIQLLDFLRLLFRIEPHAYNTSMGSDKVINIKELGIHITLDYDGNGYISALRMSDSGEKFGYFLYLDCIEGILHIENKHGVVTHRIGEDLGRMFRDIHKFFISCESPAIVARLRDLKIEDILKD